MHILHVIPSIATTYGGSATTMRNIISLWNALKIVSHVLTLQQPGAQLSIDTEVTQCRGCFPNRFSNSLDAINWMRVNSKKYNLVIFHSTWTLFNLCLALVCRLRKIPYIVISHGSLDPFDLQKKAVAKQLLGPLLVQNYLKGAVSIVCSTEREANDLESYGAQTPRIVLPWSVTVDHVSESRDDVRKRLKIANDAFVIISIGRIDYKKGFPVLVPALKIVKESYDNVLLLIVGPDSNGYKGKVQKMVAQAGVEKSVRFIDTVQDVAKSNLIAACDCLALPSLNENFGNVVVEAMQLGLPVVVSESVYIADKIKEAGAGIVCQYDAESVARGILKLIERPLERKEIANRARLLGENYQPAALAGRYADIVREILYTARAASAIDRIY
jgi:glycosyltransferase involved in cell wall biosynthesis